MREATRSVREMEVMLGPDPLTEALRGKIREMILALTEAELKEVLGARPYERSRERQGYRHGKKLRSITTGLGAAVIEMPRARLIEDGREREWQSKLIRRYERRAPSVNCALLGAYLAGANGRRIRGDLSPLLRGAPLSKSAISRLVGRLQALFSSWRERSLKTFPLTVLYLDAIALRVRIANKVLSAPVLVALGVGRDGQKEVLDLELLTSESTSCWSGFVQGLISRGLRRPRLVIIDGNKGLRAAVEQSWPKVAVQRCTVHKLRNLERHVPRHALEEMRSDYHGIIRADSLDEGRKAYREFFLS